MNIEELAQDVEELKHLRPLSARSVVQACIDAKIGELERKMQMLQKQRLDADTAATATVPKATSSSNVQGGTLPRVKIITYALDQSDKFLKIYVTVPKAETITLPDQISVDYGKNSVSLLVRNLNGSDYEMIINDFLHDLDVDKCQFKLKKDTVLLMLKKKKEGEKWDAVTKVEKRVIEKRTPKLDEKANPQVSQMTMMKQMYDDDDDEMKRTIRKAWHESQDKSKKGGDGMPGEMDI